jgi:hypothetical protein
MAQNNITGWIRYWAAANLVAVNEIASLDDVKQARRFCAVMRDGVFSNVTDAAIWQALQSLRSELLAA